MATASKKYGTVGYIVGYDGQLVDGEPVKGSFVLPIGGINGIAELHSEEGDAINELAGRSVLKERSLGGFKSYVLKVHKVRLSWFPFAAGHIGYRKVKVSEKV